MLQKGPNGTLTLSIFSAFPKIVHGFSTRKFGTMKRPKPPRELGDPKSRFEEKAQEIQYFFKEDSQVSQDQIRFAKALGIDSDNFVFMDQPHGSQVREVFSYDARDFIQDADGLITKKDNVFPFVAVADCVPMLFYDPINKVCGICHAGWRGTLEKIGPKMIGEFKKRFDSKPSSVLVGIGPSIGPCCYEVKKDVSAKFEKMFGKDREIIQKRREGIFIDLRLANYNLLLGNGCTPSKVDIPITCTSCQNDVFYSFRKEKDKLEGEIGAVIGLIR